jgi:signal transduction histidine kinase
MQKSLAQSDAAITMLSPEPQPGPELFAMADTRAHKPSSGRAAQGPKAASRRPARKTTSTSTGFAVPEGFYRDLVWNLRNGVLAITRDGQIAVMNDNAYGILGLKARPSDMGRSFVEVLRELPDVCRILGSAFDLSHLPNRAELRVKKTGKVIGYTLSHVRDNRNRLVGATLFFKDLTRVEQEVERERLRDRLAALGEMAAAIAHEVKNPLAGIEVMAGILKRELPASEDAQTILADIIKEAKMANAIVLEVLEFVRPIRLQVEHIALPDVVRDAISMADSHVPKGDVRVSVDLGVDVPPIQGDPHQLRQLFTNLLTNAFEALEGRGDVRINALALAADEEAVPGVEPAGPMVEVSVSDSGPGVPPEVADRIFSPFFTTKPQGSGLGLAIVRKIIDAHDGRIDIGGRQGGGTTFRVTLPVKSQQGLFG